jgi:hypothetical protein
MEASETQKFICGTQVEKQWKIFVDYLIKVLIN